MLETIPDYDLAVYHMGNNLQYHEEMYAAALRYSGLVVLHDYVLHHLLAAILLRRRKDWAAYYRELEYCHGSLVTKLGDETFASPKRRFLASDIVIDYPLNDRLVRTSRGVVIHSRFVERRLRQKHPDAWLRRIEFFSVTQTPVGNAAGIRAELGISDDALLLGSFGFMTPEKRIPCVLESLAMIQNQFSVHYLLVGELIDPEIEKTIERTNLKSRVHVTGYVDETRYLSLIQACDVCVNLRYPTMGETSAVLCQCLGHAKPCLVTNVGWYSELPDDIVRKIEANDLEVAQLVGSLTELEADPNLRQIIGEKGQAYMAQRHDPILIGDAYLRAFGDLVN